LILSSDGEQLHVLYEFHPIGGVGERTVLAAAWNVNGAVTSTLIKRLAMVVCCGLFATTVYYAEQCHKRALERSRGSI